MHWHFGQTWEVNNLQVEHIGAKYTQLNYLACHVFHRSSQLIRYSFNFLPDFIEVEEFFALLMRKNTPLFTFHLCIFLFNPSQDYFQWTPRYNSTATRQEIPSNDGLYHRGLSG